MDMMETRKWATNHLEMTEPVIVTTDNFKTAIVMDSRRVVYFSTKDDGKVNWITYAMPKKDK